MIRKGSRKKVREVPALNTASLPDIIFMLLFFFMVTTTLKKSEVLVMVRQPQAGEAEKLEKKSMSTYIFIGKPLDQSLGNRERIQVNDAFAEVADLATYIETERAALPEANQSKMITSLKVDKDARMGLVSDVEQELRRANALNVNYSAKK